LSLAGEYSRLMHRVVDHIPLSGTKNLATDPEHKGPLIYNKEFTLSGDSAGSGIYNGFHSFISEMRCIDTILLPGHSGGNAER
jgi:hypothetical protein